MRLGQFHSFHAIGSGQAFICFRLQDKSYEVAEHYVVIGKENHLGHTPAPLTMPAPNPRPETTQGLDMLRFIEPAVGLARC